MLVDPDGREIKVGTWLGRALAYLGVKNYEYKVQRDINDLKKYPETAATLKTLEDASEVFYIKHPSEENWTDADKKYNCYVSSKNTIYYDPDNTKTAGGRERTPKAGLIHEAGHAENDHNGTNKGFTKEQKKAAINGNEKLKNEINNNERNSIQLENVVYKAENAPLRDEDYIK